MHVQGDGCGCGASSYLGQLPRDFGYSPTGFGFDSFGDPWGAPSGTELDLTSGSLVGDIWGEVKEVLGDAAGDLARDVTEWIQRRIGRETWDRMPQASKEEAIRAAREELTGSTGFKLGTGLAITLGVAALLLLTTSSPRRR